MPAVSPTLELARQRSVVLRDPEPTTVATPARTGAVATPARTGAVAATIAIAISWVAGGALVIGIAWIASTLDRRAQIPADTLPYALAWSGASAVALVTSVASLFWSSRRTALLGTAALLTAAMFVAVVVALQV